MDHFKDTHVERIVLLTEEYPYGKTETFLENEIVVLASLVDEVLVIPRYQKNSEARSLPENCKVVNVLDHGSEYNGWKVLLKHPGLVRKIYGIEKQYTTNPEYLKQHARKFKSSIRQCIHLADLLVDAIPNLNDKKTRIYSYWMNDWALTCSILKIRKQIHRFVFRVHGFDLYDERQSGNYMPFRKINMENADMIGTVSKTTCEYLKAKNIYPEKVTFSYLGTTDGGIAHHNRDTIRLVSVANLIHFKGVGRIIDMLKHINLDVEWIHFGSGPDEASIKGQAKSLPSNIKWEFRGAVVNKDLLSFYRTTSIDMVLLFSETEGLPVSLMEAISFGIPVAATDVGGVAELVNDKTGILISSDFDPAKAAESIRSLLHNETRYEPLRLSARQFWVDNFEARKNYTDFYHRFIE